MSECVDCGSESDDHYDTNLGPKCAECLDLNHALRELGAEQEQK